MKKFKKYLKVFFTFVPLITWAYPEMIRNGYTHCAACHFNPAGGGVLNPYGRSISAELLSRWSTPGEERILHGALSKNASSYVQGEKPVSAIIGGDLRYLQYYQENSSIRRERAFLMQADAEVGVKWNKLVFLTTYGQEKTQNSDHYRFRKTSLVAAVNDVATVKVGRAQPNLGLMIPEHIFSTRSDSGLRPLDFRDLVEIQGDLENSGFVLGVEQTPYERRKRSDAERGYYAQFDYIIDTYKFGLHYWGRKSDTFTRHRVGADAMLGLSKKWAFLAEYQFQQEYLRGQDRHWGFFSTGKLTYEAIRGFWFSLWLDYSQRSFHDNKTAEERAGPGIQFFPRPHFELEALWLKDHPHTRKDWGNYAMVILHYYL